MIRLRQSNKTRGRVQPGVYRGVVVARSSEEPGRDHTYTVSIDLPGGSVEFVGVAPSPDLRWTTFDPTINIIPFRLGQEVVVMAGGPPHSLTLTLNTYELTEAGPCPQGEP
jgi:hypothetical protein